MSQLCITCGRTRFPCHWFANSHCKNVKFIENVIERRVYCRHLPSIYQNFLNSDCECKLVSYGFSITCDLSVSVGWIECPYCPSHRVSWLTCWNIQYICIILCPPFAGPLVLTCHLCCSLINLKSMQMFNLLIGCLSSNHSKGTS